MIPLLLHLALSAASAQEAADPFAESDESALFRLDEALVTVASRYAQTVEQAPSIVSVITADTIRTRGYRTVSDALRELPGIYVWKSPEGRDLAAIRGVIAPDNNKVLLLVDGIPWYDGVYTHAFIDDYLPIGQIKQIEVIEGPGSAIYGTNAFAGVINVVTWDAASLQGVRARWDVGGNGRSDIVATAGGTERVGGLDLAMTGYARVLDEKGFGIDVNPNGGRNVLGEDPKSGMAAGVRLEFQGLKVQIHHVDYRHTYLTRQSADTALEQLATDINTQGIQYHDTMFDLRYAFQPTRSLTLTPHLWSQKHDDPGTYFYGVGTTGTVDADGNVTGSLTGTLVETEKNTRRWGYGLDVDARPGIDHHIVAGVGIENTTALQLLDWKYDGSSPTGSFANYGINDPDRDPTTGPYAKLCNAYGFGQYEWIPAPGVEIVAGSRVDQRYGCGMDPRPAREGTPLAVSPRAALLIVPSPRVTAKFLYGEAFRYGTLREVLVQSPVDDQDQWLYTAGNVALRPERIRTAEAEVRARSKSMLEGRADVSYSQLVDEINEITVPQGDPGQPWGAEYLNADASSDLGTLHVFAAQLEGTIHGGDLVDFRLAYGLNLATYANGLPQYEYPTHMGKGDLTIKPTDHLTGTLSGEVYSTRPRSAWSPNAHIADGAPFGLLHLAVALDKIGPQGRVGITGTVRNLASTVYDTGNYRIDADAMRNGTAKYPDAVTGEGRTVDVAISFAM